MENMKVWNNDTMEDATIVIGKSHESHPALNNICWKKLQLLCTTGFMTEIVKENHERNSVYGQKKKKVGKGS